ncbi:MAG TPA: aldehyde dehydrogenase family protein [Terriglobia bacterium]|nr:aldehyde dehydrogenase family protein [Terriglobia bacterium]
MTNEPPTRPKLQSLNPSTGKVLAEFDAAGKAEVERAVSEARRAAESWRRRSVSERVVYLQRLKAVVFERRDELAALITRETGKPILESITAEVMTALDTVNYFCRHAADFLKPQRVPHHNPALKLKRGRLEFEPLGVIGIISPSNYPFGIPLSELVPALAAGNAVVLKPSELTPQVGLAIGELLKAAGFPDGVASLLLGDGDTGRALVSTAVDKLIFTGSVSTGKRIQTEAAERLLPTVLELGGKDPMIVCEDADLEHAANGAVWGAFTNTGQACLSVERLYVARKVAEEFTRRCVEKTKKLRVGPGEVPTTDVGPLIRERQVQIVEAHVADAVAQGAKILTGGKRPQLPGFFYEPTVLTNVHHGMRVMREETFGPLLPILPFNDEAEAIRLANDSDLGLSASVWTRDRRRGERMAREIQAGAVMVNDCASYFGICEAPHGGVKLSGLGRTHSRLGLMEMVRVKYLDVDLAPGFPKVWWFGYDGHAVRLMRAFTEMLFAGDWSQRARGFRTVLWNAGRRIRRKD